MIKTQGIFTQKVWRAYCTANRKFADKVIEVYDSGDVIWVHDYHLLLLPSYILRKLRTARAHAAAHPQHRYSTTAPQQPPPLHLCPAPHTRTDTRARARTHAHARPTSLTRPTVVRVDTQAWASSCTRPSPRPRSSEPSLCATSCCAACSMLT